MAASGAQQHNDTCISGTPGAVVCGASVLVLQLPTHCTLPQAAALRASLLDAAAADSDVELDAKAVEVADTAGLQLLLAFITQLQQHGRCVQWAHVGTPLQTVAKQLGLLQLLGFDGQGSEP
jgi:anti-anti-sigma regulatory factor